MFPYLNWLYTLQTSILTGYAVLVSVKPVSPGVIESPGCSCVSEALEGATEHLAHVASRVSPLFCRLFWTTARPAEDFPSPAVLWGAVHPYSVARYCFCAASVFLVVLLKELLWMACNLHSSLRKHLSLTDPLGSGRLQLGSFLQFSSVTVVSDSLWPHGLQQARPPCPSRTPGACSNSCPLSRWCHPTISSSVLPFSSCLQSFPASGSFLMSVLHNRWPKYWSFSFQGSSLAWCHSGLLKTRFGKAEQKICS